MKLSDSRVINADVATVWAGLLDPDVLKACVPGCTEMSGDAQSGFEATVVQKVGPIKATFKGEVEISNTVEHQSLTLSGAGKGGAAGYARGGADVSLEADGNTTVLHYEVDAKVGGKLAQLGSRVVDGFAKKMANQFFENFSDAVGNVQPEAAAPISEEIEPVTVVKKSWFSRLFGKKINQ